MRELAGVMQAAAEVQAFCQGQGWQFCFIGGMAVQRWGMPRFTQDVDLTLLTGLGGEEKYIDTILRRFPGRLPDSRSFAIQQRVLLARTPSGVDLDFSLGAFPFEEASIGRASIWTVTPVISLLTCSAEDLIIHKVFAGRDRDWADVESILARQHGLLDLAHIQRELPVLLELKEDNAGFSRFEKMVSAVDDRISSGPS
jgi:hypothetical protein